MISDTSGQDKVVKQKPSWHKHLKLAVASIAVVSSLALVIDGYQSWQVNEIAIKRDDIRIAEVVRGDFVRDISAVGKVVAAHAPSVYATTSGNIELLVQPGDAVSQGQVVARLTSEELTSQLKQQQSMSEGLSIEFDRQKLSVRSDTLKQQQTLDMAEVALKAAKREHRRAQTSIKQQLISQIDFEKAVDDLARAELEYNHASQEALLKKDQLAFELKTKALEVKRQQLVVDELIRQVAALDISAPLNGIVGNLLVEQRSQVMPHQALLTVVDLTAYEAEIQVPENFADELGLQMRTEVTVSGAKVQGYIVSISPEINNNQVTARVRFDGEHQVNLRQNQRVSARILLENKSQALMVKRGAFLQSGGKFTYLVQDSSARRVPIEVGAKSIGQVEILSGAKEGDTLVISNLDSFEQAQQVYIR